MSDQLKPCPFCGSHNIIHPLRIGFPVSAECANCHACGPYKLTANEATEAWNRRASQWLPIDPKNEESLPPFGVPVWLSAGKSIWLGGRGDDADGWLWGRCYSAPWLGKDGWEAGIETDDDYKPTSWQPLPEAPKE